MTNLSEGRVGGVLVTYNRPDELDVSARALAAQTHPVSTLIVVDNGTDNRATQQVLAGVKWGDTHVVVVHAPENLGPAGGIAAGCRELDAVDPVEWVLLLDDDDPLPGPNVLNDLLAAAVQISSSDAAFGGIAMKGARFHSRSLRTRGVPLTGEKFVSVDHLHGGYAPLYSRAALRDVGEFDEKLFWGFEELEAGLRLTEKGWNLYMAVAMMQAYPLPAKYQGLKNRPGLALSGPSPEAYYKLRNLTYVGWRHASPVNVVVALLLRAVVKPLANLVVRPGVAMRRLAMNGRAVFDGSVGRMGRRC